MADFSDSASEDSWVPDAKKQSKRAQPILDDTNDGDDEHELVGCTSEEEEEDDSGDGSVQIIGSSFCEEEEPENDDVYVTAESTEDNDDEIIPHGENDFTEDRKDKRRLSGKRSSNSTTKSSTAEATSVRRRESHTENPLQSPGKNNKEEDAANNAANITLEITPSEENLETERQHSPSPPREFKAPLPVAPSTNTKNLRRIQITSTPVLEGFKKPLANLNITAIPLSMPNFNETVNFDESPKEILPYFTRPDGKPDRKSKKNNKPSTLDQEVEDMLIAGLNDISLRGAKQFSFTQKLGAFDGSSKEAALGATCRNYFDFDEEEEEDDDSVNFDFYPFDDGGCKDSDTEISNIQALDNIHKQKKTSRHVADMAKLDDDIAAITEKIGAYPLGQKTSLNVAPRKTIILNEPPPIQKKTYSYDPSNQNHREFYGDVQRTISKMAHTIETMPMPKDGKDMDLPSGLVPLFDHQRYGLCWLSWREREYPGGGILADEMGLGKTIMIIALIMKSKMDALNPFAGKEENWMDAEDSEAIGRCIPSKTTLVVCPVGCLLQWNDEISNKGKGLRVRLFHGPHRRATAAQLAQYDVVLTTYHTIIHEIPKDEAKVKAQSPLMRIYWNRIVLDEAHNIRNPKTASAQSICKLTARHRWAVTGTPIHNRPEDFFSIAKFLKMKPFDEPKVWDFWIGMKQVRRATGAQERLHTLGKALILRRTKQEVQEAGGNTRAIPPKTIDIVTVELSEEERRVYDHLMTFAQNMLQKFLEDKNKRERELNAAAMTYTAERRKKKQQNKEAPNSIRFSHLFALLARLRQCAVLPHLIEIMLEDEEIDEDVSFDALRDDHIISKINPVFNRLFESSKFKKILEDVEAIRDQANAESRPMDKVVITSSWTSTLDILYQHFRKRRFSCVFITGRDNPAERADNTKKFNNYPEKYHICLLSLMAGGVGLNLVGGNHVFFVEPHWNPQLELQAQDRVHRFGQTKNVFIKKYIAHGTVEDKVTALQNEKMVLADGLLNSAQMNKGGGLSLAHLKNLFI